MNRKIYFLILLLSFFVGIVNVKANCVDYMDEAACIGDSGCRWEKALNGNNAFCIDDYFYCTMGIDAYIVSFSVNGEVLTVDQPNGQLWEGNIVSRVSPKSESECPKYNEVSIDVENDTLYIRKNSIKVNCGNITGIPKKIPELTSYAVTLVQVAIPVLLVIMGSIDLFKGITAQKEDEIKKGQHMFIKRLIVAVAIFFVVAIVKVLVSLISDATNTTNIVECIDCFISGVENCKV